MAITIDQFRDAQRRSANHPYPVYVRNLKDIGVREYEVTVTDESIRVTAKDGSTLEVPGKPDKLSPANTFVETDLKGAIFGTQTGLSDYKTFLAEIADAGVHRYVANMDAMKIIYYGKNDKDRYEESIPEA